MANNIKHSKTLDRLAEQLDNIAMRLQEMGIDSPVITAAVNEVSYMLEHCAERLELAAEVNANDSTADYTKELDTKLQTKDNRISKVNSKKAIARGA